MIYWLCLSLSALNAALAYHNYNKGNTFYVALDVAFTWWFYRLAKDAERKQQEGRNGG